MLYQNSPLNCTSIDLETEAIRRFRSLTPSVDRKCHIFRELNGLATVLCLDFKDCPLEIAMDKEEWQEFAKLTVHSSHYLGLANSVVFKLGDRILSWMTLNKTEYFGEFLDRISR